MKEYEPYKDGMDHHQMYMVSKEEQVRRKKEFLKVFKDPLLKMGFIQKGKGFYRLYGCEEILQVVMYSNFHGCPSIPYVVCHNAPLYEMYDSALMDGYVAWRDSWYKKMDGICIPLENFCNFTYPGTFPNSWVNFFSVIEDFDKALQEEYELFCERAVPKFERDYIPEDEYKFASMIIHKKWDAAEAKLEERMQDWIRWIKHTEEREVPTPMMLEAIADRKENVVEMKKTLERIAARDEEYFKKQIKQMMEYGHEELNAISPRILRAWQARG